MSVPQTKDGRKFAAYRQLKAWAIKRKFPGQGVECKIEAKEWKAACLGRLARLSATVEIIE